MSPAGRRSGNPDTRTEILDAARRVFGESGYDGATIRGIASRAGVDPALVHHYFGTKDQLFAASISLPFTPGDILEKLLDELEGSGERMVEVFLSVWENEQTRASLMGMLRTAMAGEEAGVAAFREFMREQIQSRIAPRLDGEDADVRAMAIASHLVGIAIVRYVVRIEPLASVPAGELAKLVGPRVESYLRPAAG